MKEYLEQFVGDDDINLTICEYCHQPIYKIHEHWVHFSGKQYIKCVEGQWPSKNAAENFNSIKALLIE